MAVSIFYNADPAGVSASGNVASYTSVNIATATSTRITVLVVTSELASATIDSATIDTGGGATAMTAGTQGNFGAVYARAFYALTPSGTTATFAVTFGANPSSTQNHISVYAVLNAAATPTAGGDGSTDMDATDPLTTGSITVVTDGGFIAVAAGATGTGAKAWVTATEDLDVNAGAFRHTTATYNGPFTATAVTCTGSNNEDGAMSWLIFAPLKIITAAAGSYALTGTAASLERGRVVVAAAGSYALTGTAASLERGRDVNADAGSYALTGTATSLEYGREVVADVGAYALTGVDAGLVGSVGDKTLAVDAGSYALTGTEAALESGYVITAAPDAYALTGSGAALEYGRVVWSRLIGEYALTGSSAVLGRGREVVAGAGSYTLTGTAATLVRGREIDAGAGSYTLTGASAGLTLATPGELSAEAGSYTITGTSASLATGVATTARPFGFIAVDPYYFDAVPWADETSMTLYNICTVPRLSVEDEWRGWAREVCDDPLIATCEPPNPDAFDDWREWASLFNNSILSRSAV